MASRSPFAANSAPHETEARAPALTALLSDWYWEQDEQSRLTFISEGLAGKTGLDPAAFLGQARWEYPAANMTDADWARHRAQLERREPFRDLELKRVFPSGRAVWISVSGEPVFDPEGRFKGYRGAGRDITAQKRLEELLRLEHAVARVLGQAATLSEGLRAGLRAICDAEGWEYGRCVRAENGTLARLEEGWFAREPSVDQLLHGSRILWQEGKPVWSSAPVVGGGNFATFAFPAVSQGKTIAMLVFSGHGAPEPDRSLLEATPAIGGLFGQFLSRMEAEESLRQSEARFRGLTHMSSDFFWESDAEHRFTSIVHGPNYAAAQLGRDMIGQAPWAVASLSPDAAGWAAHRGVLASHLSFRDFEFSRMMPDGGTRHFALSGEPRFDGQGRFTGYRGVGRDVTEIAQARERIALLAYSDALTGLANRISLGPALEQAIERARRRNGRLAGVFVDLDGFKAVNDQHGHAAGDAFLVEVGRRLRRSLRASDLIARLGGDEFFVLLEDVRDTATVERVVGKLVKELLQPFEVSSGVRLRVSASMGVSLYPGDAIDATTLVDHADKAMYTAKKAGKNAYCLYAGSGTGNPASHSAPIDPGTVKIPIGPPSTGIPPSVRQ
ncbi:MAG TPA: diguanylate cyclase [Burkholderiales bacterium]|nr:diguanylate cyclase [Burkholderiales bacterium]